MSDLSVLSQEYKRYSDLARSLTADLILLKRLRFRLPGSDVITEEEEHASTVRLAGFVRAVENALSKEEEALPKEIPRLPGALIERIQETYGGTLPRFRDDLRALEQRLSCDEATLTDDDMDLLDNLINAVHGETSNVFSRLWRK